MAQAAHASSNGIIDRPNNHSVDETVARLTTSLEEVSRLLNAYAKAILTSDS